MNELYREHEIVLLPGSPKSAVIVEQKTGTPLPTKITALPDEADGACFRRARELIDLYLESMKSGDGGAGTTRPSAGA